MSYTGKSPKLKRVRYIPQSVDPISPQEGDLFYSDGTPRAEGLWYYKNAAWQVVIADNATITQLTMDKLNLVPLSADPIAPPTGEIFYSNGTSRESGLWIYDGTNWVQISRLRAAEFKLRLVGGAQIASTANVAINGSTPIYNGQILDGVTLVTNQVVLLKNQNNTAENGLWVVPATQTALNRYFAMNTGTQATLAVIYVFSGAAGARTTWFQSLTVTNIGADPQSWSSGYSAQTWTVPRGVFEIQVYGIGGGGGGGGGGGRWSLSGPGNAGSGGGGGQGSALTGPWPLKVTPGATLSITLGAGGVGGGSGNNNGDGGTGLSGQNTIVSGADEFTLSFTGGTGGGGGKSSLTPVAGGTGNGNSAVGFNFQKLLSGGAGGVVNAGSGGVSGQPGSSSQFGNGGAGGQGIPLNINRASGGGGGGGGYMGVGGDGGNAVPANIPPLDGFPGIGYGSGGGGGAGSDNVVSIGGTYGSTGGYGYVRITW